jgi:hypothetical protein
MKKEFLTGLTALVLAIGLVIVGCDDGSTDDSPSGPTAAELAATALAAELNALTPDAATATGATVNVTVGLTVASTVTVPSGVTLALNSGTFDVQCNDGLEVASGGNVIVNDDAMLKFTGDDANGHINGTLTVKSGGTTSEPDGNGRAWGGTSGNDTTSHTATGSIIYEYGGLAMISTDTIVGPAGRMQLGSGAKMTLTKSSYKLSDGDATVAKEFGIAPGKSMHIDANCTLTINITIGEDKHFGIGEDGAATVTGGEGARIVIAANSSLVVGASSATNGLTAGTYDGAKTTTCTGGTWSTPA